MILAPPPHPTLPPLPTVISAGDTQEDRETETVCSLERGRGGAAQPNDGEKAESSINLSILSAATFTADLRTTV